MEMGLGLVLLCEGGCAVLGEIARRGARDSPSVCGFRYCAALRALGYYAGRDHLLSRWCGPRGRAFGAVVVLEGVRRASRVW